MRAFVYTLVNPRGQLERVESKLSASAAAMAKRAESAHSNGLETLPIFYGAVLAALHAGISKDFVGYYSGMFLVSRALYNVIYILNTDRITALARSTVWGAGMYSCLRLFLAAASSKRY
ncbi:hypothetical protein BGZ72_002829 [Mortierella alpina]|nr:hypothetical protein BGZ72_002829 [Mortierella alpina]